MMHLWGITEPIEQNERLSNQSSYMVGFIQNTEALGLLGGSMG